MLLVLARRRERHLVGPERPLHGLTVDERRTGPSLGRPQHDHRPSGGTRRPPAAASPCLDVGDDVEAAVERRRHRLVDVGGVVAADDKWLVAVAAHELEELRLRDAGEHRRIGDLVAVQVQHRQHRSVAGRIEEAPAVPARGQRTGLGLAVADDADDEEVGLIERSTERVEQRVAELAALVERARCLRCAMARHAARERELAEEGGHALGVAGDVAGHLGVGPLEPGARVRTGATVAGAGHEHGVEVAGLDHPVHVGVHEVQARHRAEVPEEPRLHVLR